MIIFYFFSIVCPILILHLLNAIKEYLKWAESW